MIIVLSVVSSGVPDAGPRTLLCPICEFCSETALQKHSARGRAISEGVAGEFTSR